MSSNKIFPFPKEYYTSSENVRKTGGDLDDTKYAFVTTTDIVVREGNTDMVDKKGKPKQILVEEPITPPNSEKGRLTHPTKQINHKHPIKQ